MPIDLRDNILEQGVIECAPYQGTGYVDGEPFAITLVTVDGRPVERQTANADYVMQQAAARVGVGLRIVSGFRTMAEQQYLYGCYINCNCNNCNLAARPGYSNHQSGHALYLNTAEAGVLNWLNDHGGDFGFSRTVPSENRHWEWWGGGPGGGPCVDGDPECLANPSYGRCDGARRCAQGCCLPHDELDCGDGLDDDGDGAADCADADCAQVEPCAGLNLPTQQPPAVGRPTVAADGEPAADPAAVALSGGCGCRGARTSSAWGLALLAFAPLLARRRLMAGRRS